MATLTTTLSAPKNGTSVVSDSEDIVEVNEDKLSNFQIEIQEVTQFVKDPEQAKQKEQEEQMDNLNLEPSATSMSGFSATSNDFSQISDELFVHGAVFSAPQAEYHPDFDITNKHVFDIHQALTQRSTELYFTAPTNSLQFDSEMSDISESDEDNQNAEELSEERKQREQNTDNDPKTPTLSPLASSTGSRASKLIKKIKTHHKNHKRKKRKKKTMSERGLTFQISEGHVFFNWTAFIREWLYNFFHIFALPLIYHWENKSGCQSRYYWPCDWGFFGWFSLKSLLAFWFINITHYMYFQDDSAFTLPVVVFNVLYCSRITVVAIKWGYMPTQIFEGMRKAKLTEQQYKMIHLLTGWVNHENTTGLAREIGQSCARLELDVNRLSFRFRDERSQGKADKAKICSKQCSMGGVVTYGNLLIPYIVFCSSKKLTVKFKWMRQITMIVAPIITILPVIGRMIEFQNIEDMTTGMRIIDHIWYFLYWFETSMNLFMLILFCSVIACDFERRYNFVRFSTRLVELRKDAFYGFYSAKYKEHLFPKAVANSEQSKKWLDNAVIQTLDLSHATTLYNWTLLRAFFLDFGKRFLRREEAILSYFILSITVIVAFYFSGIYFGTLEVRAFEAMFVLLTSFSVLIPMLASLQYASGINEKVSEQRAILADKRVRLEYERQHIYGDEDDYKEGLLAASVMLKKIVTMLEIDRFTIRLLGYDVDTTVTGVVAAVVGAVGFASVRILLNGDDNAI